MKKLGRMILITVIGEIISSMALSALTNVIAGKDILGNKVEKDDNRVDYLGRIHLGRNEYEVV